MATNVQRWQAICDALLNKTSTPAQSNRLAKALCEQDGSGIAYEEGTNDVKAGMAMERIRKFAINSVKSTEATTAASLAALNAVANIDSDFQEGP